MDAFWVIFFGVIFGVICSVVASNKGRSPLAWFFAGLLLGPIGLILSLVVSKDEPSIVQAQLETGTHKKCPYCAEMIQTEAMLCKHCGKEQPPEDPNAKLQWVCPSCNAITKGNLQECWACNKPRPEGVVLQ